MTGTAALDPRSVPARPTLVEPVGPSFDEIEMEFGPVKCKATAAMPLSLQNTTGSYSGNISGLVQFSFTEGIRVGVTGAISGQMTARPIVQGEWTGSVKCEWNIPTAPWTIPIGGPLAWFYGLQVATGIGLQMKGALELGQVGFDMTANASAQLQMVYECLPPAWICGLQNSLEPAATGTLKPVLPDLADARVKLSGRGYLYGKLQLGPNRRLLQAASFLKPVEKLTVKLAEANAGIEQTLDVAGPKRQATDPAYASSAELHLNAEVGLDVELKLNWEDFARKFGYVMQVADVPLWADTIVLSRSPRGTFAASPSSVKAGNDTDVGDFVTFTFDLDPVTYVGAYSVDKVEILWLQPSGGSVILANSRPPCTTLTPTATGQAQLSCQVDFLEEHAGRQTFVGFVYPRLFGVPLPIPFEVSPDSRSAVEVTVEGCPASSQAGGSGSMGAAVESCEEPPGGLPLVFTFNNDLEGWGAGTTDIEGWGTAEWRDFCGSDRPKGCVKLDGVGGEGLPNAWIFKTIRIPAAATKLEFETTAHNRQGADSFYRVRLIDDSGTEHILVDWTVTAGQESSVYLWKTTTLDISRFAGQEVVLYFEGADNGPGAHEQRYYDNIAIR